MQIGHALLLDRLGVRLPIIQAPMAGVSTPAMAAAVTRAGGLGSISVGATDQFGARASLDAVAELTTGPVNINVFCHQPAMSDHAVETSWIEQFTPVFARYGATPPAALVEIYRSFVDDEATFGLLLEQRPRVVSFHFGLPRREWIDAFRANGVVQLVTVTSLAEAAEAVAAGLDAVVAQGWEAGGHRGAFDPDAPDEQLPALELTRRIKRRFDIDVIAAGGIMNGSQIATALAAGASAVQMGTAFLATRESLADAAYRAALAGDAAHHTIMSRAISGRPARGLPTRFTAATEHVTPAQVPAYPLAYDLAKALNVAARAKGEAGFGVQWAGTGAPLCRALPVAVLMRALERELQLSQAKN